MARAHATILSALLVGTIGCATLADGRRWGDGATLTPGWERVGRAARRALLEPGTWLPAAGAALFSIDDFDSRASDWAVRRTPVFGSTSSANDAGDLLYGVEASAFLTSLVATPSGEGAGAWSAAKVKGLAVEGGALLATEGVVSGLKGWTDRTRPNRQRQGSFPSGHATNAFALATLTARNLDSIEMSAPVRVALQTSAYTVASATAWARVEAEKHFPSDVLAGAAIAHFLNAFIHDAFLGLPDDRGVQISFEAGSGAIAIGWAF